MLVKSFVFCTGCYRGSQHDDTHWELPPDLAHGGFDIKAGSNDVEQAQPPQMLGVGRRPVSPRLLVPMAVCQRFK